MGVLAHADVIQLVLVACYRMAWVLPEFLDHQSTKLPRKRIREAIVRVKENRLLVALALITFASVATVLGCALALLVTLGVVICCCCGFLVCCTALIYFVLAGVVAVFILLVSLVVVPVVCGTCMCVVAIAAAIMLVVMTVEANRDP